MQSISARIALLIAGAAAALALIIGHSPMASSSGQDVAGDNGWSAATVSVSAAAPVTDTAQDNGWS
ncbi:hypothetical protein ABZY31_22405 [Streptomyces sp. NPDC006529]|uniref:hypothetical protein n=1 Tax=Streptomyces sp. NPDC006529 TaxID=3157177 RepID=UPI0033BA0751